jgi:hypothetical protein
LIVARAFFLALSAAITLLL